MAREGPNLTRRADIERALKRVGPKDKLTLEQCAIVWGVVKSRFVSTRNEMADFPAPEPGQGNTYIYPARKALLSMQRYEMRHDEAARARQERTNQILGRARSRTGRSADVGTHTPNELATLARMAAEAEQRERDQGLYVPVADNAAVASIVFGVISEYLSSLANQIDPHGLLGPDIRTKIDDGGADLLLQVHRKMKDVLSSDAKPAGNRATSRRVGRAQARRRPA